MLVEGAGLCATEGVKEGRADDCLVGASLGSNDGCIDFDGASL